MFLALAAAGTWLQVRSLDVAYYFEQGEQLSRHRKVLNGGAGNPWGYRILSEWFVEAGLRGLRPFGVGTVAAFEIVRVAQLTAIFALLWAYLRRVGLPPAARALGLGLLLAALPIATYGSDLRFDTYTDLGLFLIAALLIHSGRFGWILPLAVVAALNRETAIFIPVLLAVVAVLEQHRDQRRRILVIAGVSIGSFLAVLAIVRIAVGPEPPILVRGAGPGFDLLRLNLTSETTARHLLTMMNIVPFLALAGVRRWPGWLQLWGLVLVPAWVVLHLLGGALEEARLLLVPFVLVLIPGALCAVVELPRVKGWTIPTWPGRAATAVGGVLLLGSLWAPWYAVSKIPTRAIEGVGRFSAWEQLEKVVVALALLASIAVACAMAGRALALLAALSGVLATAAIVAKGIGSPATAEGVRVLLGAYLGLTAAGLIVAGSALWAIARFQAPVAPGEGGDVRDGQHQVAYEEDPTALTRSSRS